MKTRLFKKSVLAALCIVCCIWLLSFLFFSSWKEAKKKAAKEYGETFTYINFSWISLDNLGYPFFHIKSGAELARLLAEFESENPNIEIIDYQVIYTANTVDLRGILVHHRPIDSEPTSSGIISR